MTNNVDGLVLFSGPGGSSLGLRGAGVRRTVGVEYESSAVATANAAGLETVQADVREIDPKAFVEEFFDALAALLLQSSPPCQGLSMAGKGEGRKDLEHLLTAIALIGQLTPAAAAQWAPWYIKQLTERCSDERSPLTFETMRYIAALMPEYVMLEQVPAALSIWEAIAEVLVKWGYSVWTGNVQAEQYGVPQTRRRAILMASRVSEVSAPVPTHSRFHNRDPKKLDEGVEKWVSMAEALGWGVRDLVGFPRRYDGRGEAIELDGEEYRARDLREAADPSFVVTEKARSWMRFEGASSNCENGFTPTHMGDVRNKNGCVRSVDQPAPTMTASMDNGNFQWVDRSEGERPFDAEDEEITCVNGTHEKAARRPADCPAPTVMFGARLNKVEWQVDREALVEIVEERMNDQSGTPYDPEWPADRPAPVIAGRGLVTNPGANANRTNGSTKSRNDGIRVEVFEAGILQSFPADYPWQGTKTKQFQQVGNAVPPLLQSALTASLIADRVTERVVDSATAVA